MTDCAVLDVSTCLRHFEPAHVTNRFLGACHRVFYRFLESLRRGTNQLNFFVNMIRHVAIFSEEATENNKKRASTHEQRMRGHSHRCSSSQRFGLNRQFALQTHLSFCSLALWENRLVLAY